MEKIVFKKSGPIDKLIEWFERFKGEISKDSLIVEIDTANNKFVSKTYFAADHSLVRYSEISFEDANLKLEKAGDLAKNQRVLVGIFMILPKFIDVLKMFGTSDTFTMSIDYDVMDVKELKQQLCAVSVQFNSKKPNLKMQIPGSSLNATDMVPLPDDVFNNKVWVAPSPVVVNVTGEQLKTLVCVSDIITSAEKMKNFMKFYTTTNDEGKRVLMVMDSEQDSYDYELGEITEGAEYDDISLEIYRERFLLAVKNAFADTTLTISAEKPNRILIQLGDGTTKTIIAKVNR